MNKKELIPSIREIASLVLFVVAAICHINHAQWSNVGDFPDDPNLFIMWPKVGIAGVMIFLFGLSHWLFHSFNLITKMCMRLFAILYLFMTGSDLMSSITSLKKPYEGEMMFGNIERDCWDDEFFTDMDSAIAMTQVTAIFIYIAAIILVCLELRVCYYLVRKFLKKRKEQNNPA